MRMSSSVIRRTSVSPSACFMSSSLATNTEAAQYAACVAPIHVVTFFKRCRNDGTLSRPTEPPEKHIYRYHDTATET